MFVGTYTPKLDEKGRLFLPARFREAMAEGLMVTRGQERSLSIWPIATFTQMTERLNDASLTVKGTRDYQRMLFSAASHEVPDKQGRIGVPPVLRQYAGLEKDIVVVGVMNHLEIWNPASWEAYNAEQEQAFSALSEEVFPGV